MVKLGVISVVYRSTYNMFALFARQLLIRCHVHVTRIFRPLQAFGIVRSLVKCFARSKKSVEPSNKSIRQLEYIFIFSRVVQQVTQRHFIPFFYNNLYESPSGSFAYTYDCLQNKAACGSTIGPQSIACCCIVRLCTACVLFSITVEDPNKWAGAVILFGFVLKILQHGFSSKVSNDPRAG